MRLNKKTFKLSAISFTLLSSFAVIADDGVLNLEFLRNVKTIPSVLKSNSNYPAGDYYVDVIVNQENIGKAPLTITAEEDKNNALCLSSEWLKNSNIPVRLEKYRDTLDAAKHCYILSKNPYTKVDFHYGSQSLVFRIPQSMTVSKTDPSRWDYGVPAARILYDANVSHNSGQSTAAYANVDLLMNAGRWVLSSNMNAIRNTNGQNDFSVRDATLSTSISNLKGDLLLGKSWTRSQLFNDFGFYGAALRSNSNMTPWDARGYAPIISGIANSTSRITITQGGYTLYSKMVPPGPYQLDDIRPIGNGDIVVTVEDESGHKTVTNYPITTLSTLLRPGELEYNIAFGRKSSNSNISQPFKQGENGAFWMGSAGYGFANTTLNAASILHNKYQAAGINITQSLGSLGAVSAGANLSKALYDDGHTKSGHSVNAKYAKSFSNTTDLQLLAYRYQSRGYVEFSDFYSNDPYPNYNKKSRYEMRFTQRIGSNNIGVSGWTENYWYQKGSASGADMNYSTMLFDDVSLFLQTGYSKQPFQTQPDYNVGINLSIPFSIGSSRYYNSSGFNYSRTSKGSFSSGVSASPNDRLSYSINTSVADKGESSVSGNVSYAFDHIQTGAMVTQGRNNTSLSGRVSGSIVATTQSGILLSRDNNNTIGIVRIPDVAGVRVNNSAPTNSQGFTVVNLSSYALNSLNVDMENVPDNLELKTTSYNVVPIENAVLFREFGAEHIKRYILRVSGRDGKIISGGSARTEQGVDAGFIAGNGVLLMNMLAPPSQVTVEQGDGMFCRFSMKGIEANTNKVQEIRCE